MNFVARWHWITLGAVFTLGSAYISHQYWPLFYDESWAFSYFITNGTYYVLKTVDGNNHALESLLISFVPHSWIAFDPKAIRLPNVFSVAMLVWIIALYLKKTFPKRVPFWIWGAVTFACLFSSPQFEYYLFIVRGYLLSAWVALLGIYLRTRSGKWEWLSDLLMVLSVYALASQGYILPGIFVIDWIREGFLKACKRSLRMALAIFLLNAPGLQQLSKTRSMLPAESPLLEYSAMVLRGVLSWKLPFHSLWLGMAIILLFTKNIFSIVKSKAKDEKEVLSAYLMVSILSFFFVSEFGNAIKVMPVTWQRNGAFISLFLVLSLLLSFSGWIRCGLILLALVNGILGFQALSSTALKGKPWNFPIQEPGSFAFLQASTIRKEFPVGSKLSCVGHAIISCCMYHQAMKDRNISFVDHLPKENPLLLGECKGSPTQCCIVLPGETQCRALCRADGKF